jgi:aminopeptidase N
LEKITDGRQTRFVTTDDFLAIAEEASGMDLDWFFEVYLRQPKLPKLISEQTGDQLNLRWEVPNNLPFPMPVDVQVGTITQRYEMKDGQAIVTIPAGQKAVVDPLGWVLKVQP